MNILKKILSRFFKENKMEIVPLQRNDNCFCGSGLKYKKCHALKLEPKNRIACKVINSKSGKIEIKIIRKNSWMAKSNLRWVDVGVGSNDKVD